ncbi:MAG: hypothetical protein OSB82_02610, partial [Alphaproteobacteria bacterium]|nr:hypothetical protein [Alphaproteobacteria bacterium]
HTIKIEPVASPARRQRTTHCTSQQAAKLYRATSIFLVPHCIIVKITSLIPVPEFIKARQILLKEIDNDDDVKTA